MCAAKCHWIRSIRNIDMNLEIFKNKVEQWGNLVERAYLESNPVSEKHMHLSPVISSLGYPPTSFRSWINCSRFNIGNFTKEILLIPIIVVRQWALLLRLRSCRNLFLSRLQNPDLTFIQSQHEISVKPRKTIDEIEGVKVLNDLNLSFCTLRNRDSLIHFENYICSFSFVSHGEFLGSVISSLGVLFRDLKKVPQLLSNERGCYRRILADCLKVASFEAIEKVSVSEKKYVIFWENRGWQNYLGKNYPEKIVFISLGYEGYVGPTYINYRFMKGQMLCKSFFSSKFLKEHARRLPNSYLKTLPSWVKKYDLNDKKPPSSLGIEKRKYLLLSNIDEQDYKLIAELVICDNNLFIRLHPENDRRHVSLVPKNRIENRSIDEYINDYDAFLFMGTSSVILDLACRGATCIRITKPGDINMDASSNFIHAEIGISELSMINSCETILNKSPSWIYQEIVGPVETILRSDLTGNSAGMNKQ